MLVTFVPLARTYCPEFHLDRRMVRTEFDAVGFYQALASRISRKLSWRKVAHETDISPSTFTRMAQGKRPDVDSVARLTTWAGLRVEDFIRTDTESPARARRWP